MKLRHGTPAARALVRGFFAVQFLLGIASFFLVPWGQIDGFMSASTDAPPPASAPSGMQHFAGAGFDVLSQAKHLAEECGLSLHTLTPGEALPGTAGTLRISASGSEAALQKFLAAAAAARPLLDVAALEIEDRGTADALAITMHLQTPLAPRAALNARQTEYLTARLTARQTADAPPALFTPLRTHAPPSILATNTPDLLLGRYRRLAHLRQGAYQQISLEDMQDKRILRVSLGAEIKDSAGTPWVIVGLTANALDIRHGSTTQTLSLP